MKKTYIVIAILLLLASFVGVTNADNLKSFFLQDKVLETDPYAKEKPSVSVKNSERVGDITINNTSEISDDGGLIFTIKDKDNNLIGEFTYKAWTEKNPIFNTLSNGDVVLGSNMIYKNKEKKIENLCPTLDNGLLDFAVSKNKLAFIGTKSNTGSTVFICIQDINTGEMQTVDTFKYPDLTYPANVYVSWDQDQNLYYDFYENGKPAIKVYNDDSKEASLAFSNAMNPQGSPNGEYLVFESTDGLNISEQSYSYLTLFNNNTKTKEGKLSGSRRIFWTNEYVITKNTGEDKLEVFDLKNKGKKVQDITSEDLAFEVKYENGKFKIKSYQFKENKFFLKNSEY
ncbi:MAG: hypothetical protein VR72_12370 [Clostridiaceae bacterium BRH_c20a]|nr:MAG: hypothetical protein VR72_12370 [Clostridiaceae bacterium BRH_c20a]